jgi:hypothetical protein
LYLIANKIIKEWFSTKKKKKKKTEKKKEKEKKKIEVIPDFPVLKRIKFAM